MNFQAIINTLGLIFKYISFVMPVPCICALVFKEYDSILPFVLAALISFLLHRILKNKNTENAPDDLTRPEALAAALFAWTSLALLAAIPYLYYGLKPVDALFEAVSGVTTTGGTILSDFSIYPKTMFFWRSFSQWLGGMGILVLFTAVLPSFASAGRQIFYAEAPGSSAESKLTPRIRQTAAALWAVYALLTGIEICLLAYMGMPLFDAVCNSLSCLSGGGFSPAQHSIMQYSSVKIYWTVAVFMFLSGMNFALQYKLYIKRDFKALLKDSEFKLYCGMVLIFTLLASVTLYTHNIYDLKKSIEAAFFQVVSIITTTGFVTADYNEWNLRAKLLLFLLMLTGASAGSASGGLKLLRLVFIFKYIRRQISKIYHPNGVYPIKINKVIVSEDSVRQMVSFVIFYYGIFALTAAILVFIEQDAVIGVTSAIASLGNTGPAFGAAGPMGNFAFLETPSKLVFIFNMLIGRLELMPFLALLHPDFRAVSKKRQLRRNY